MHVPTPAASPGGGLLELADGCWQGSVLTEEACFAIRCLFLIQDLLPYVVPWYKQTGSDNSWLQSLPGVRSTARPGAPGSSVRWGEEEAGAEAGISEQVAARERLERGEGGLLRGQEGLTL